MARRVLPAGLRAQLALAIAAVAALGVIASFLALYGGTSARLQTHINADLRTHQVDWQQYIAGVDISTPAALELAARRFIARQRYHPESLIIAVQVDGGPTIANDTEILEREEAKERGSEQRSGLLDARPGLSTAYVAEAGSMRVLTQPVKYLARRVGTLRIAYPLVSVERAQESLLHTFLVVGALALALAAALGIGLATLIASPLRRIARVAAAVDAGDLSMRAGPMPARGEVRVLSDAFDHMLDRLERSFKRQREFVSDASHELRTPLSVLRAQVELLVRETDGERRDEATVTLLRRLDELDRLVGDMLTLASAEAGQLIEPHQIDLHDYFEDLERDLPLFGDRDYEVQAPGGTLLADPDRLTQVLRNLIRNAVTNTNPGDQISIKTRGHGGRFEISVSDTGPGIPPGELNQIFERFHRLDQSRSRDRGGSGLGLAIARALTEAHGGAIRAESKPGRGATFRISLPGYQAPAVSQPGPSVSRQP
jgi:two-component system, OmpR family, sensor kinase